MTLTRREFAMGLAATAASSLLRAAPGKSDPSAGDLYASSFVFDANSSPTVADALPLSKELIDLNRGSGITALKKSLGGINANFYAATAEIGFYQLLIEKHPDTFLQVRVAGDFERAQREKKLGIVFSFESVEMLEGELGNIEAFRWLGVRVMQLSYNRKSPFGTGSLEQGGLTELGAKAIAKMNEIGVALDLSHSNEQTALEALEKTKRPALITHAGCAAVYDHPRNKSDRVLRAVARRGGVVGIYMLPYLAPSPRQPTLDDYMRHLEHALEVCGEDHVGIGTDVAMRFDDSPQARERFRKSLEERRKAGVAAPGEDRPTYIPELNDPRKIERIVEPLLKRGRSVETVRKVIGGNFRRALETIWRES
jgi:membrane dipeptidase